MAGEFGSTPTAEGKTVSAWQATRQCRHLCSYLRGKSTGPSRSGSVLERMRLLPAPSPLTNETSIQGQRLCQLLGTPVRMDSSARNNLSAFDYSLRGQLKGTRCELMRHPAPPNVAGNR